MIIFIEIIKIISSFCILAILPGIFFVHFLGRDWCISKDDIFQDIPLYFILSLLLWLPVSTISYAFNLNSEYPIYILMTALLAFTASMIANKKLYFPKPLFNFPSLLFSIFAVFLFTLATTVGYISQFQTGDSDAFAHLASMRNISLAKNVLSCDWVLGNRAPMTTAYGCNPWYLLLGMTVKFANVDAASAYSVICGALFFLMALSLYALLKELSGDVFLSKTATVALIFSFVFGWLLAIGDAKYYSLDPLNNLIFPQHLISYILFPTTLIFFIRYLKCRLVSDLILMLGCFLVVSRIHPSWLFWSPILLVGVLFFNTLCLHNKKSSWLGFIKLFLIIFCLSLIALAGYAFCSNTYPSDVNIISPIALWRDSGKNLLFISNSIYLYDPKSYFSERAIFDLGTILLLRYLAKNSDDKSHEKKNKSGIEIFNLLFWVYVATLASVLLVVFNPLVTFLVINYLKSSVVLYRAFSLITPFLGCITIYAVLSLLKLKLSAKDFRITTVTAFIVSGLVLLSWKADYLEALFQNKGGYYSTYHSINAAPFSYFRKLTPGVIIIDAPMATPVAALTELDPIITEVWRTKSREDIYINKKDNEALLSFSRPKDELLEIITRRNIRYIYLSKNNMLNSANFKKYPELVHLKSVIDGAELWEVNEGVL